MRNLFYSSKYLPSIRYWLSETKVIHNWVLLNSLCIIFIWTGLSMVVMAQNGELRGTITDKKTGEPLFGATVFLIDTDFGAATSSDGQYVLSEIPANTYNIRVSFIGYQSQIIYNVVIRSEGNIDVDVQLEQAEFGLDEVVVSVNPFTKLETTPFNSKLKPTGNCLLSRWKQ